MRHQPSNRDRAGSTKFGPRQYTRSQGPYRKPPIARKPVEPGTCCVDCGWPFKTTSSIMLAGQTEEGATRYKHAMCPSLSERRRMRAEALENV